jgi:iron complex outermembrane receptor protein
LEYASSAFSVVASGARSVSRYQRQEQYNETEGDEFSKVLIFPGSALKLGLNYNLNDNINIFFAGGQMSKAPKFSNAYLAYSNTPNTGAKNEEITSMDLGVTYRSDLFDVTTTYYMNTWKDKSIVIYDAPDIYNITGLSANHSGLELEADVRPMDLLSVEAALSFGNWKWGENVDGTFSSDYDRTNTTDVTLYTDGLMVGYQPQTQMSMGLNLFPMPGLMLNTSFRYNDNFYAGFSPSDYDDISMEGKDVVKLPSYSLLDIHTSYKMNLMGTDLTLGAHLLNALDSKYITYGEDQGFEDDGSNSSPKVFYGSGMQFRLSFKVSI